MYILQSAHRFFFSRQRVPFGSLSVSAESAEYQPRDGVIELIRSLFSLLLSLFKTHIELHMRRGELTRFLSTSSGTFLVELHSALAALCEKITGALVVCRAALIVLVETCERSTNMPSLFNSLTTACRIMRCVKIIPVRIKQYGYFYKADELN